MIARMSNVCLATVVCIKTNLDYLKRHILVECTHFAKKRKDVFGKRNVVESFRFHPTLILLYLKESVL